MSFLLSFNSALRWFAKALVVIVIILATACIGIYVSAKRFERRAGLLCTQVKSLKVGSSTFDDVQRVTVGYHRDFFDNQKECTSERCGFEIHLNNTPFPVFYDARAMWRWGVRPAQVRVVFVVSQGKLRYASFRISTRTQYGYWLEGEFNAVPSLTLYDKCRSDYLGKQSAYAVQLSHLTNGDGNGLIVRTAFGVEATRDQVQQGTNIRISCITARPSCKSAEDLMPDAKKDFSFAPDNDKQFTKECEEYVKKVEVGDGPWPLESAFNAKPVLVNSWILTRSPEEVWIPKSAKH